MSISQLFATMCADLSDADLNSIRKARGFSTSETASRDSFANYFVSSIGMQEVMQQLSEEESITLHLLRQTTEVDISFFERLYGHAGQSGRSNFGTYTQRFRPIFDAVKKNLVRKGLLIMAEIKVRGECVQMERWRFALPYEFTPYLPPLLQTRLIDQPGETNDRTIRKKLLQLIGGEPAVAHDQTPIHLTSGCIQLGEEPFTVKNMIEWQTRTWQNALTAFKPNIGGSLNPVDVIRSLFADLNPGEWVAAKSIEPVLKIFCYGAKMLPVEKTLQLGWELGALSRLKTNEDLDYRLSPELAQTNQDNLLTSSLPWLQISPRSNAAKVDLRLIPLYQLELLNGLMQLSVEDNVLLAHPSLIQLGHSLPVQRQSPLSQWLAEKIPTFQDTLAVACERWGKTLLHENLLFARVRDLSLRIQLERELGQKIVVLSDHFIAFPIESRSSVEKVLKKSGFVVKMVRPETSPGI
jgi:hypothetical protein